MLGAAPSQSPQSYSASPAYGRTGPSGTPVDAPAIDPARLAGIGLRLGAAVLDALLPLLVYLPLVAVVWPVSSMDPSSGALTAVGLAATVVFTALMGYLAYALVQLGQGRSPGKKLLSLRVIYLETGRPAGFWRMLLREVIGKWVSAVVLYLGFFWAIWDERHQGWHDKIAKTVVVREDVAEDTVREDAYRSGF